MAYAVIHHFPGGTKEQYEAGIAASHPGGKHPEGQFFHAAGPSPGGWTIVGVHDTKESYERFLNNVLIPLAQKGGVPGGFTTMPVETAFETHALFK